MTISTAARAAGVSSKAVRLWEAKGLLPQAPRTVAGYRIFTDSDVALLRCIREAKSLNLSLAEIKEILELRHSDARAYGSITDLLAARIAEMDQTIDELRRRRTRLATALADARKSGLADVCGIIETATSEPSGDPG